VPGNPSFPLKAVLPRTRAIWVPGLLPLNPSFLLIHQFKHRFSSFKPAILIITGGFWHRSCANLNMGSRDVDTAQLQELFEPEKSVKNPFVPLGALATAGVLTAGLVSFRNGNYQLSQKLMRARVVTQAGTVALMLGTALYYGKF